MTSTAHLAAAGSRPVRGSTWPRVRRQRTPNGAMSIWELSTALGNAPAEPSGRTLTPEQTETIAKTALDICTPPAAGSRYMYSNISIIHHYTVVQ